MNPLHRDPDYLYGQVACVRQLVLGIANRLLEKDEFRAESITRLESLRAAWVAEPVPDAMLQAVDDCERWLEQLTS